MTEVRIATRRSRLALAQSTRVAELLTRRHSAVTVRLVEVETSGDLDQDSDIVTLTETGAFVTAVQQAVLDGRADLAVHSLKDLPVGDREGLVLAAIPERAAANDVLVGGRLDQLPPGATVGTGSPRRSEQLLALRPDLTTVGMRGNVDTRLDKVAAGEVAGTVLAEAGLARLGLSARIAQRLAIEEMVPAPGQGALAVEARPESKTSELASAIDDEVLRPLLEAERGLLACTGAGCRSALGALATWEGDQIRMDLFVSDEDGRRRATAFGSDVESVVAKAQAELGL
jgi:hydroxymethylbilane synthase